MAHTIPQAQQELQVFPVDSLPADGILAIFPNGVKLLVLRSDLQPEVIETIRATASQTAQDDTENEQGDRVRGKVWFSGCQTAFDVGITGPSLETPPIASHEAYESVSQFLQTFAIAYASISSSVRVEGPLPTHYQHTSVRDHAPRLVEEGKWEQVPKEGDVYQRDRGPDKLPQKQGIGKTYDVVATLKDAADKTGVPIEEIMTIRDIQAEWDISRRGIQQLMRRKRQSSPRLTPLSVRLQGFGGQLLYWRSDVESTLADPRVAIAKKAEQPKPIPQDSPQSYEVVATLRQAADKTGLPLNEIVTTREIQAEWNVNRTRVYRWTQDGPDGQPRLTPLPVRLKGGGIGGQSLYRRSDIEGILADPPKGGRPRK